MKRNQLASWPARAGVSLLLLVLNVPLLWARPWLPPNPLQDNRPRLPAAKYIRSRNFDTRNIALNLRFDWDKEQAIGLEKFTFAPLVTDLRRIELDAGNMTINSVMRDKGGPLAFEYDAKKEKLVIGLDRAYQPAETVTLIIDYRTNGDTGLDGIGGGFGGGLKFIRPTPDNPKQIRQIWSQGESEYNHYWFPCYDHPNDFFTSEMTATVEAQHKVISNGKLLSDKKNADGTHTVSWKMEQPHAPYLVSLVVGEYALIEEKYAGIPVQSYVYPNEVAEGKNTTQRLAAMVKFFSEKTGVKYPYAKYAQTMARDFGGGMENISATTQTDTMIQDARTDLDGTQDSLQSHELAHQWFGDYVTCRTWGDIWLNESFATYFQALWDEQNLGRDEFLYRDVKSNKEAYYNAWASNQRRPIVTKNYNHPDDVFDTYAYPRGGAVLHMLRTILGDADWWRSINRYLTTNAHKPVSTEQLRIAIEETTGQSMDWFFDQWLYRMGHPVFRVTKNYDAAKQELTLTVRQEQKPDLTSAFPQVDFFQTPVDLAIATNGPAKTTRVWLEPKEEQSFTFKAETAPVLVSFDSGDMLIKELIFDKTTDELLYQLKNDTEALGRVWALGELKKRLSAGETSAADKSRIVAAFNVAATSDTLWGVRRDAVEILRGNAEARSALQAATKDKSSLVRASAIRSLAALNDATLAPVYLAALQDPSYGVVRAATRALAATQDPQAYDALARLVATDSWRDNLRAAGLAGLSILGDKRSLEEAVRYAARGNPTGLRVSALSLLGRVGKADPRAFPLVADAAKDATSTRNFQLAGASFEALVNLADERGLEILAQAKQSAGGNVQALAFIEQFEKRLKQALGKQ